MKIVNCWFTQNKFSPQVFGRKLCLIRFLLQKIDLFTKAQLKLTLQFILAVGFLAFSFGVASYLAMYFNLETNLNQSASSEYSEVLSLLSSLDYLPKVLLAIFLGMLILSGFWGYWLAGLALGPLQQNMEAQKKFFADASHELRTPLTIMKADLEVTIRNTNVSSGAYLRSLSTALKEVNRMSRIVDDFLILSRGDNNQDQLEINSLVLSSLLDSVVAELEPVVSSKGIQITLNHLVPVDISADQKKIRHAFLRLLKSMIDFSPPGQRIEVETSKLKGLAEVTVINPGLGIPKEDFPFVFNNFYRIKNLPGQNYRSNGLGLAIVKTIINKHQGSISMDSQGDQGVAVTVRLPLVAS